MQKVINLEKVKEKSTKMINTNYLFENCEQNETYEDFETTWGYKSMDFIN